MGVFRIQQLPNIYQQHCQITGNIATRTKIQG